MKSFISCKQHNLFLLSMLALVVTAVFSLSNYAADKSSTNLTKITIGQTLYTQYSMFYENYRHKTTNYRKGILLPVNTAVKFVKSDSYSIVVTLQDGNQLTIDNIANFSGENIEGIFARTFSTKPLDLTVFTEAERKAIMMGEVKPGMRKSAVIVAIGYPPKHKTPNLQMNQWRYWLNRFNTFIVNFENDKVSFVQD